MIERMAPEKANELRPCLRGPLILPGEPGYDDARSIWNAMIDRRPAAVARCLGVADVQACIHFARDNDVPFSIKGGGHNIAGLAVLDGGLMIDTSLMRGVWVDPVARTARAQCGCLLGDVDRETQVHGLAAVMGFVSNTGIAGLTVGGGIGYLTRRFGWTSDTVLSMEVVTADGNVVRADERENADLFWGLRGGGGNFGVVTNFDYRLYPVGPEIVGGAIAWRIEDAEKVMGLVRELSASAPRELDLVCVLRPAPPAPWLPKEVHGRLIAAIFVCCTAPLEQAEKLVAPIKQFGSPLGDVVVRRPYVSQQNMLDATQPKGRRYYWKSEYLAGLDPDLLASVREHAGRIASPHSAIILFPLEGALNELPGDHSPAGNRDAQWVLNIAASWEKPEEDAQHIEWARAAWRDLRRFSTGGTYINFLTEEESGDRIEAAYGPNHARLITIKRKWDPENLFRANKNIAP
jgi:FAD/FMN-containing dehydrogenase